jgi:hypothetical protein
MAKISDANIAAFAKPISSIANKKRNVEDKFIIACVKNEITANFEIKLFKSVDNEEIPMKDCNLVFIRFYHTNLLIFLD